MAAVDLFRTLTERLGSSANVKNVYGEPIVAGDKTIVPVAKVAYGFGGGSGRKAGEGEANRAEESGGGGGGVAATPAGVIEITPSGTRFVAANANRLMAIAALAGFGIGWLLAALRHR